MQQFDSFGGFARHLTRLAAQGEEVGHLLTQRAAAVIQDDAQAKIGVYQNAVNGSSVFGWPDWMPLAEATVMDRIYKGFSPFEPLLRTGALRDSITATIGGDEATIGSTSDIALYQELGTEHIPPRPFLGPAGFESKPKIGALGVALIVAWISGLPWRRLQGSKLP